MRAFTYELSAVCYLQNVHETQVPESQNYSVEMELAVMIEFRL